MASLLQRGEVWECYGCHELLAAVTKGGHAWVRLEARRLPDTREGLTRLVCPRCQRVNCRKVEVRVRMGAPAAH